MSAEEVFVTALDYLTGQNGKTKNPETAAQFFQRAAEMGNVEAMHFLGDMAASGTGTIKSETEACKWYFKAANQGHVESQFVLADHYETGKGVDCSPGQAARFYLMAAEKGHAESMYRVGKIFATGKGVESPSPELAFSWYKKAAVEKKHVQAMSEYGNCLLQGIGTIAKLADGVKWSASAAHLGDKDAAFRLHQFYLCGHPGLPRDPVKSFDYAKLAGQLGDTRSIMYVASVYAKGGQGVPKDVSQSAAWYHLAGTFGLNEANAKCQKIVRKKRMRPVDLQAIVEHITSSTPQPPTPEVVSALAITKKAESQRSLVVVGKQSSGAVAPVRSKKMERSGSGCAILLSTSNPSLPR
jgi:TPR repeat protein